MKLFLYEIYCSTKITRYRNNHVLNYFTLTQGYNFRINDNFEPIWMEDSADAWVEFVELVNRPAAVNIP